jgi:hypothetical protein
MNSKCLQKGDVMREKTVGKRFTEKKPANVREKCSCTESKKKGPTNERRGGWEK